MLEANKKLVSLKSCYLKIRIDFVNQILRNKEKVKQPRNVNILTRTTDRKILYLYSCLSNDKKNRGPGPYNSLSHNHSFQGVEKECIGNKWVKVTDQKRGRELRAYFTINFN